MAPGLRSAVVMLVAGLLAGCGAEPSASGVAGVGGVQEPIAASPADPASTADAGPPADAASPVDPASPADAASPPAAAAAPSSEGLAADAFAFSAPAVGGGQVEGAELEGEDLALWFWAPWCPQCNREAAGVAEMARQFDGQVRVVGVAGRDQVPAMEDFVAEHGLEHVTSIADVDGAIWQRFGVVGQPTWIFVDGETGATAQRLGRLPDGDLANILQTLEG